MPSSIECRVHPWRAQGVLGVPAYHAWPGRDGGETVGFHRLDDGYLVRYPDIADFQISLTGDLVQCWPAAAGAAWQALYEQQMVPLALAQTGAHVFHGGAVTIAGAAVAFVGCSGLGKSTLVTACAARGHAFFADDCLLLEESADGLRVKPHVANIRLWPDSMAAIAPAGCDIEQAQGSAKPRVVAGTGMPHAGDALPLRKVYVLGDAAVDHPRLERLSLADAVIGWASNRFVLDLKDRQRLAANLGWAARVVAHIPACRLDYPRRYDALGHVVAAVVADVTGRA